ncbi:MAG: DNA repair protein RecO [Acholeplasmatales bacterium]|nr:DNA repair protein RecO [Acholeplasmatales bacterium]
MKNIGIVINSIDYKESSKIVYLYTPLGRDSVKASGGKGIKKGYLGFTTTGNVVSYVRSDAKFPSLIEYSIIDSIFDITNDINKLNSFGIIIKIINSLPDDINHERTYNYIIKVLNDLKISNNPKKVLSIFLIKILYTFGVAPNLKTCVTCNNENINSFSINLGGALCKNCGPKNDKLNIWNEYYYDKKSIDEYQDVDFDNLLKDIYKYYSIHANINLDFNNQK